MSVVGKLFLLMFLPVFQTPDTDHLDQKVLGSRALLGFFFLRSILGQTSPDSPSDILSQGWKWLNPRWRERDAVPWCWVFSGGKTAYWWAHSIFDSWGKTRGMAQPATRHAWLCFIHFFRFFSIDSQFCICDPWMHWVILKSVNFLKWIPFITEVYAIKRCLESNRVTQKYWGSQKVSITAPQSFALLWFKSELNHRNSTLLRALPHPFFFFLT